MSPHTSDSAPAPSITWLGHATALAELGSARVLFDPLLRRRVRGAGRVDAVLVTHSHADHLNRWTLAALDRDTHLVVPRGSRPWVADLGFAAVTEVDAGDELEIRGLAVTAVPTRHRHGRWRRSRLPVALGYVVRRDGFAVHHAGDIDFSDHAVFDEIGRRHAIDVALLPIGGMLPVWYYRWRRASIDRGVHIDPDRALELFERLGAGLLVPVHWGTLSLRLGPTDTPSRRLRCVAAERCISGVRILAHGQRLALVPATARPARGELEATPTRAATSR